MPMITSMNRLANSTNPFQGKYKKVLCVCSAGLLRSPTAAFVLSQEPYNFNTRACGYTEEFALVPLDPILIHWADEILVMGSEKDAPRIDAQDKPLYYLGIPDKYPYRDPDLIELIKNRYAAVAQG